MTSSKKTTAIKPKLTAKQKVFVNTYIRTRNGTKSSLAVQPNQTYQSAAVTASRTLNNANVQQAIDNALMAQGATPEFAVSVLKEVADQKDEIGARRLAAKDILELHGWRKQDKPIIELQVSEFFGKGRNVIDLDPIDSQPTGA